MRLLHTADWHIGRTLRGRSRLDEQKAVLTEITGIAREEGVELVLVAGDLFDSAAPTPEAEQIVYQALMELASTGAGVFVISGNHDHPKRLDAVAPLLDAVRVKTGAVVRRPEDGGMVEWTSARGERARIILIPFLSQRYAVRAAELLTDEPSLPLNSYVSYCQGVVSASCHGLDLDAVNILMAHLTVLGGELGGGERQAHTIFEYYVPADIFPSSLNYVALGHLHAPQSIAGRCPVWYSGSPLQLDFGEGETKNCVLVVETSAGKPAEVRRRDISSGRRLLTLTGTLDVLAASAESVGDAYVKLVLRQPSEPGLAESARSIFPNAVHVITDSASSAGAAASGMELDLPPSDLFKAFLDERGIASEKLLPLFKELMEEASAS